MSKLLADVLQEYLLVFVFHRLKLALLGSALVLVVKIHLVLDLVRLQIGLA